MTEKRFTYENHKVKDNLTGEVHSSNMVSVNVLNQLNDENEQLKKELSAFKPVMFQDMRKGTVILYSKE